MIVLPCFVMCVCVCVCVCGGVLTIVWACVCVGVLAIRVFVFTVFLSNDDNYDNNNNNNKFIHPFFHSKVCLKTDH